MPYKDNNQRDCGCDPVQLNHVLLKMGINEGRPKRDDVISKDEIMNLSILLHTTTSVDAFLKEV